MMGAVDVVEFLRARLDEDEAEAREAQGIYVRVYGCKPPASDDWKLMAWDDHPSGVVLIEPERVLREVEAKRAILESLADAERAVQGYDNDNPNNPPSYWQEWGNLHALRLAAESFASVYVDHPDYRQEWA